MSLSLNEMYKCGSAAKGTTVGGHSDLDVVVVMNHQKRAENLQLPEMLDKLKLIFEKSPGIYNGQPEISRSHVHKGQICTVN